MPLMTDTAPVLPALLRGVAARTFWRLARHPPSGPAGLGPHRDDPGLGGTRRRATTRRRRRSRAGGDARRRPSTSSTCGARFATRMRRIPTTLGLSQADVGLRAGDWRQAVSRRTVRCGRQHRLLSRRPATTRISSMVTSFTFSTKKQTSLTNRLTMFVPENRWRFDGDHRFQWTSLDTYALGTSADTHEGTVADFDFFRLHNTAYYGSIAHCTQAQASTSTTTAASAAKDGEEVASADSPYVEYSLAHGLPLDSQTAAGTQPGRPSDNRDSFINADHGWLAKVELPHVVRRLSRRRFELAEGQPRRADVQEHLARPPAQTRLLDFRRPGRRRLARIPGPASTAGDTYGRSARGYAEGQFRGERLAYGEIEYRGTLMRNGLVGMVAFLNTTTVSNLEQGERIFDSFAGRRRRCTATRSTSDRRPTCAWTSASASKAPRSLPGRSRKPSDRCRARRSVRSRTASQGSIRTP